MKMTQPSNIVVQKYGGSSVADLDKLRLVASQVASAVQRGLKVVVVVSAMGKTTDELLRMASALTPSPSRRELDMLLSTGERISMALLAMALSDVGVDAISFTGSQSGIVTNDRHSGARIIEVRPIRIEDELERGKVVIVAGFQGVSYKREITTLGRGGSDTTAVALAAALGADACEIYSDVDGVYSADPRVVSGARHLKEISYEEMQELAEHGARVLNAQAVEWAKKAGIVIYARKTGYKEGDLQTSVVSVAKNLPLLQNVTTAVTASPSVLWVYSPTHGEDILSVLLEEAVPLRHHHLLYGESNTSIDVSFVKDDLPDLQRVLAKIEAVSSQVIIEKNLGCVTAVGPGPLTNPFLIKELVSRCTQEGIWVRRVLSNPLKLSLWVDSSSIKRVTQLAHATLIEHT